MMRLSDLPGLPPIYLLGAVLIVWTAILIVRRRDRRRRVRWLLELARATRMNFSPGDRFDLTQRLRQLPEWAPQSIDLVVTDVLYAAQGDVRRFVATATYHRAPDERPRRFVFGCVERLPQNVLDPNSVRPADESGVNEARYRSVIEKLGVAI